MKIKKVVITAAGPDQRHLPLQSIVNRAGEAQTALGLLLDEVFAAGVETAAVVIAAGDTDLYKEAVAGHVERVKFIEQEQPLGYGHAVWCARDYVGKDPYLLMVSDHLYLSHIETSCVRQLLDVAGREGCAISAVQATSESKLRFYGAVGGSRVGQTRDLYEVDTILEKPSPTVAEQHLIVPGLRSAQYLCFFGMHVLGSDSMASLGGAVKAAEKGAGVGLTETLQKTSKAGRHLALEINGRRFNIAEDYGLMIAQLAMALNGPQRDEILTKLVELLATTRG